MKLTRQQNMVINCLQNGWGIITDSEMKGAVIATNKFEFKIGNRLFWNLVDLELIRQNLHSRYSEKAFKYQITEEGLATQTKDVQMQIIKSFEKLT